MSVAARLHSYTFADYLGVEGMSAVKHEFLEGEIYAVAGGSALHAALAVSVGSAMLAQLRAGPCRVYSSDLRVRVKKTGLVTYPDISVVCGPVEGDQDSPETATNPAAIVEVLSDSTMEYDLGEKFEHYRRVPSLRAVVYVWQRERKIEVRQRIGDSWTSATAAAGGAIALEALAIKLLVDDVYRDALLPSL